MRITKVILGVNLYLDNSHFSKITINIYQYIMNILHFWTHNLETNIYIFIPYKYNKVILELQIIVNTKV